MPRVRWSATLEHDEEVSASPCVRKSSLKPPSMGQPRRKPKSVVRKERQRRRKAKEDGVEAWRERGKLYRAKLIMKDEESGGDAFTLSDDCEIEQYYDVSERVLEQFLNTTVEDKAKLTEAYLVGNRLVKFVSRVLPTHSDYFSNDPTLAALRSQSQAQLVQLLQYLEELALIIDEEEYQEFIRENQQILALSEEEPPTDDEDSEVSSFADEEEPSGMFGEGPPFAASDAAQGGVIESQNLEDFEVPRQSRIRAIQNQESQSWDQAFSKQIAPKLPELVESQRSTSQQVQKQHNSSLNKEGGDLEWAFPADFGSAEKQSEIGWADTTSGSSSTLPVDFSTNTWPSEQITSVNSNIWNHQDQRQGPDSSFSASPQPPFKPPKKMTLRPKALYGSLNDRESSPKSVYELPEFMPEKSLDNHGKQEYASFPPIYTEGSVEGYLQRMGDVERPPPSDDGMSALSGEEEEASLTGAPVSRRRRMGHFKGCVRCLLE